MVWYLIIKPFFLLFQWFKQQPDIGNCSRCLPRSAFPQLLVSTNSFYMRVKIPILCGLTVFSLFDLLWSSSWAALFMSSNSCKAQNHNVISMKVNPDYLLLDWLRTTSWMIINQLGRLSCSINPPIHWFVLQLKKIIMDYSWHVIYWCNIPAEKT